MADQDKARQAVAQSGGQQEAGPAPDTGGPDADAANSGAVEQPLSRDEIGGLVREALQGELTQAQTQAQRLRQMSGDERAACSLQQALDRAAAAEAQLNALRMRDQAQGLANERRLPAALLADIDFSTATAEQVGAIVKLRSQAFDSAVEQRLNERLRQPAPQARAAGAAVPGSLKGLDYRQRLALKQNHPELYHNLVKEQ